MGCTLFPINWGLFVPTKLAQHLWKSGSLCGRFFFQSRRLHCAQYGLLQFKVRPSLRRALQKSNTCLDSLPGFGLRGVGKNQYLWALHGCTNLMKPGEPPLKSLGFWALRQVTWRWGSKQWLDTYLSRTSLCCVLCFVSRSSKAGCCTFGCCCTW